MHSATLVGETVPFDALQGDASLQREEPRRHLDAVDPPTPAQVHDTSAPPAASAVAPILRAARERLGMDVAWLAEFHGGEHVFRAVDGDQSYFGAPVGEGIALEGSYCQRMVDGRIPNAVPDVRREPEVADLDVTRDARMGSYVGVPVRLRSGRLYGSLCCSSHRTAGELDERDVALMHVLAESVASHIERDQMEAERQQVRSELDAVSALLAALEARDAYTGEHSRTVVELAGAVARDLAFGPAEVQVVEQVALLHDLGKVGVPDAVLQKRGPLTPQEWEVMREHPAIGARIVTSIPSLRHLAPAVRAEHERWDGRGYPDRLAGEDIPVASRIALACDAYHAMTSDRPYRSALSHHEALAELRRGAGSQFDASVVASLYAILTACS